MESVGEILGKAVRDAWIACKLEEIEQGGKDVPDDHLLSWGDLDERNKEIDRRIGLAVAASIPHHTATMQRDFIMTEGDLRGHLETTVRKRLITGKAHCIQIRAIGVVIQSVDGTVEVLSPEMIADMRDKGQLDFSLPEGE